MEMKPDKSAETLEDILMIYAATDVPGAALICRAYRAGLEEAARAMCRLCAGYEEWETSASLTQKGEYVHYVTGKIGMARCMAHKIHVLRAEAQQGQPPAIEPLSESEILAAPKHSLARIMKHHAGDWWLNPTDKWVGINKIIEELRFCADQLGARAYDAINSERAAEIGECGPQGREEASDERRMGGIATGASHDKE